MPGINPYSITNTFETNNVANKSLMEIGGYTVPGVIMANNKIEARERAEKSIMFFGFSMLAPLIFLPAFNKAFLKMHKVKKHFKNNEHQIMQMSKEYLSKDSKHMVKGIKELGEELKTKQKYKNVPKGFDGILDKFKGKEDDLQKRLIKVHRDVLFSDFMLTGGLMGSVYWISNSITKKKTGRDGFSAEYEMADKDYVENKAKKYKQNAKKNFLIANGILLGTALTVASSFHKGMKSKGSNFLKKHIKGLDYKNGIYMSRAILAGVTFGGDLPNTLLSSRDKEELKYNIVKNGVVYSVFFGGDLLLNNITARVLDKTCKDLKLINKEKLPKKASIWKKLTAPLYSMKELENKKEWAPDILKRTKRCKVGMFWGSFAAVTAFMGFGTPYVLNKMVRKKVESDTKGKVKA